MEKRVGAIESTASAPTMGWGGSICFAKSLHAPELELLISDFPRRPKMCAPNIFQPSAVAESEQPKP